MTVAACRKIDAAWKLMAPGGETVVAQVEGSDFVGLAFAPARPGARARVAAWVVVSVVGLGARLHPALDRAREYAERHGFDCSADAGIGDGVYGVERGRPQDRMEIFGRAAGVAPDRIQDARDALAGREAVARTRARRIAARKEAREDEVARRAAALGIERGSECMACALRDADDAGAAPAKARETATRAAAVIAHDAAAVTLVLGAESCASRAVSRALSPTLAASMRREWLRLLFLGVAAAAAETAAASVGPFSGTDADAGREEGVRATAFDALREYPLALRLEQGRVAREAWAAATGEPARGGFGVARAWGADGGLEVLQRLAVRSPGQLALLMLGSGLVRQDALWERLTLVQSGEAVPRSRGEFRHTRYTWHEEALEPFRTLSDAVAAARSADPVGRLGRPGWLDEAMRAAGRGA